MSISYLYYYGIREVGKSEIYPLAPFKKNGKLYPIYDCSGGYATGIENLFWEVGKENVSEELRTALSLNIEEDDEYDYIGRSLRYLTLDELPKGTAIKRGYFLQDDVTRYLKEGDSVVDEIFYDRLEPEVYAAKLQAEISVPNLPRATTDCEGEEMPIYRASDYMYFAYEDPTCPEYTAKILRQGAYQAKSEAIEWKDRDKYEVVVLLMIC